MTPQEIKNVFNFRHACKTFVSSKKISSEEFECIMESARLSPSSFGFEPWSFLIIQNKELRQELREVFWGGQGQIPTASHVVLCLVKKSFFMRYDSPFIQHMMEDVQKLPPEVIEMKGNFYKNFQEKDFDLLSSEQAMTSWATHQTYIALGNMMTVAAMLGIDSCPMEGFDRKAVEEILAKKCDVDLEKYTLGYGVAFGYRVNEPFEKTRQKMEDITAWY